MTEDQKQRVVILSHQLLLKWSSFPNHSVDYRDAVNNSFTVAEYWVKACDEYLGKVDE